MVGTQEYLPSTEHLFVFPKCHLRIVIEAQVSHAALVTEVPSVLTTCRSTEFCWSPVSDVCHSAIKTNKRPRRQAGDDPIFSV